MKGDLSRRTFLAAKHYHSVQMQQGRVQLDADWNEQIDLTAHRVETETVDVVGAAGGPQAAAGFAITPLGPTDFRLGAGRYYVDGLLVVNEADLAYSAQDDHPGFAALVPGQRYLVYLDVWQRHLTFLDDPALREVALGGPDTATRVRTTWQVKVADTTQLNCIDAWGTFLPSLPASGKLRAGTEPATASDNPCLVRPTAGYRGLENQLYRVELHRAGAALDLAAPPSISVTFNSATPRRITAAGGTWAVGDGVQITSTTAPDDGPVFLITAVTGLALDLHAEVRGVTFTADTRLRRITGAMFKWSRDNGAIAARIKAIDPTRLRIEVDSLGPDDVLGFRDGDLVELSDDRRELGGPAPGADAIPGELLQIKKVYPGTRTVELVAPATFTLDPLRDRHPKLRKWNGLGMAVYHAASLDQPGDRNWVELELGLRVRFTQAGHYRTGDYWQIAARASNADGRSGNIEWPFADPDQPPFGIAHHLCPLAVLDLAASPADQVKDCRSLFPPLTQLRRLCYVGGDGQEVMPDLTDAGQLVALPHPLVVGVVNGLHKVVGARIEFTLVEGDAAPGDQLQSGAAIANGVGGTLITTTGPDGTASCIWRLRGPRDLGRQVRARLLDVTDDPEDVPPILFGASRSVASQVAFAPPLGCPALTGATTVQTAIEALAHVRTAQATGGDGQDGLPGAALPLPIEVEIRDHCGPIAGARVSFAVASGGLGAWPGDPGVGAPLPVRQAITDGNGRARVFWRLGPARGPQEATATLLDGPPAGLSLRFTANAVALTSCGELVAHTAQELRDLFAAIPTGGDAHICIAPGRYDFDTPVEVIRKGHLKISGGGDATLLHGERLESVLRFVSCASVTIRDLRLEASLLQNLQHQGGALELRDCARVTIEHLRLSSSNGSYRAAACLAVLGAASVRIRSCDLTAGDGHLGIMVIDALRSEIEDNTVQVAASNRDFRKKLADERRLVGGRATYGRYVDGVNKLFMHPTLVKIAGRGRVPPVPQPLPQVRTLYVTSVPKRLLAAVGRDQQRANRIGPFLQRVTTVYNEDGNPPWQVTFATPELLVPEWFTFLRQNPLPPNIRISLGSVKHHLGSLSDRLVTSYLDRTALPARFTEALDLLAAENRSIGAQGILVAGKTLSELRITDNTVTGFSMGIHVGHSADDQRPHRAARTIISGNTISVRVNGETWHDRHGIFSGNSENTLIEGNSITADLAPLALTLPLEGIRVHGTLGPMLMIRANQILDCSIGVRARALNPASRPASIWRVHDNAVRGTTTPFDITPPMP